MQIIVYSISRQKFTAQHLDTAEQRPYLYRIEHTLALVLKKEQCLDYTNSEFQKKKSQNIYIV